MRLLIYRQFLRLSCGLLLFLPLGVVWPVTSGVDQTATLGPPGFSIAISTSDATIQSGKELIVNVLFNNISNHAINLELNEADYRVEVRDEHGELVRPTQHGRTL